MDNTPESRLAALSQWIESATKDLTRSACKRLDEEFHDHYHTIVEEEIKSGSDEDSAHEAAMASLGSSFDTQLASLSVHGDPHRLRIKAVMFLIGLVVCSTALWGTSRLDRQYQYTVQGMWKAIESGDVEALKEHLDYGLDPNSPNSLNQAILHKAFGSYLTPPVLEETIRVLLDAGANPNAEDEQARTVLFYLINREYYNNLAENTDQYNATRETLLSMLIDAGADLNEMGRANGYTLMESASFSGDSYMVKLLQSHNIHESLRALVYQKRFDTIKSRIEKTPSLLHTRFNRNQNLLHYSITRCDLSFVQYLVEQGLSPTELDSSGNNLLIRYFLRERSNFYFDSNVLRYLLDLGFDVNYRPEIQKGHPGHSAIELAAMRGNAETIQILVDYGADIHMRSRNGETPLHRAVGRSSNSNYQEIINALIELGADVDAETHLGHTPLHYARDIFKLKQLLEHGASPNIPDAKGNTPLHSHSTKNSFYTEELLPLFEAFDVKIDAKNNDGETPHHLAIRDNRFDIAQGLLIHGADPYIPDAKGLVPAESTDETFRAILEGRSLCTGEIKHPGFLKKSLASVNH